MSVRGPVLAVAMAERHVSIIDLNNPAVVKIQEQTCLRHQTRCISVFADLAGYAVGSIEGRVAIQYFDKAKGGSPRE